MVIVGAEGQVCGSQDEPKPIEPKAEVVDILDKALERPEEPKETVGAVKDPLELAEAVGAAEDAPEATGAVGLPEEPLPEEAPDATGEVGFEPLGAPLPDVPPPPPPPPEEGDEGEDGTDAKHCKDEPLPIDDVPGGQEIVPLDDLTGATGE